MEIVTEPCLPIKPKAPLALFGLASILTGAVALAETFDEEEILRAILAAKLLVGRRRAEVEAARPESWTL